MEKPVGGTEENEQAARDTPAQQSPPVLLETLAARMPEPVVVSAADGEIRTGNDHLCDLLDSDPSDVFGSQIGTFFPGLDDVDLRAHCSQSPGTPLTSSCSAGGTERWVEIAFEPQQWDGEELYLGIVHDITERHERTEMLEQYERIVETIEDGIYTLDEAFTMQTVNSAVESMTGYDKDTLVGSNATLLADESVIEEAAEMSRQFIEGERDVGTLTTDLRTADGDTLPIETKFTTYDRKDGSYRQVGVVRDISDRKRFEETLAALHESTRKLLHTETKTAVAEQILDTAVDVLELPDVAIYLFDRSDNTLRSVGDTEADRAASIGPGESTAWDVFVQDSAVEVPPGESIDLGAGPVTADAKRLCLPLEDHGVFYIELGQQHSDARTREMVDLLAASAEAALARVDRETTLREREAERREQNRELRRLKQVNAIIRRIDQVLVEAETTEEIEQAVCDQLAESQWFSFAWLGRQDATELVPRAWAGDTASYLDAISLSLEREGGPPAVQTAQSEAMTIVPSVADNLRGDHWRTEALSREFQSALSIPLEYDDFVYGVLTVYAQQEDGFDEMLQEVFAELGETIANAIQEVESRQRRAGDGTVELELSLSAPQSFLTHLSDQVGAPVICEGAVQRSDGATRLFLAISDCDPAVVEEQIVSMARVDTARSISTDQLDGFYEVVVTGQTVAETILEQGGRLKSIRTSTDGLTVTVVVSGETDVRQFVEQLGERYANVTLIARRDGAQSDGQRDETVRSALEEQLTDRQFEVLQTAYLSGFFDWPRETTGQEIAASLDVSQPTVNRHLRVSERKLLELVFGDS
ncbi:PAS domain S-box protein [Haloarcula sp. JP-Z28]|uniref:PAS domain S-box protein n=1 Tax=Haloarcula sp. JP-Z28 TaxID=2716715 RepID=UPI001404902D|nr:bacterio-opsin activator domain-containing protein [Haloarcula sp. JP-Z28]NHN63074.1 PAS domain S-box protein [Haloarcula sp. JP-Z28]